MMIRLQLNYFKGDNKVDAPHKVWDKQDYYRTIKLNKNIITRPVFYK